MSEPPVCRFVDYGTWAGASSNANIITKATLAPGEVIETRGHVLAPRCADADDNEEELMAGAVESGAYDGSTHLAVSGGATNVVEVVSCVALCPPSTRRQRDGKAH